MFSQSLVTEAGDWAIKGFIDVYRNIYTISADTKSDQDFTFLLQEKWRLASDRTGSGNTKNIGSVRNIDALVSGNGTFAPHGRQVFDDYWMNYLTDDMARAIDSEVPYRNIEEYWLWRNRTVPQQS